MKKILFFGGLLLSAMTFVACSDEDYTDWANPQSNPQEEAVTLPGFTASSETASAAIDLAAEAGDSVKILSLSEASLPAGAVIGNTVAKLLPADNQDVAAVTLNVSNSGYVAKSDLQTAVETFYGKRPTERTLTGAVTSNIISGNTSFYVNAGTIKVRVTPEAPFIAEAYYLVGDFTSWADGEPIKFSHSGTDVYEDPVFTVTFNAAAGNCWQIIPQNNIDSGDFWHKGADGVVGVATDGDTSLSGTLVATEGVGAGKIENEGTYRMTINMLDYTYTIEQLVSTNYYLVGSLQGWKPNGTEWDTEDNTCVMYPQSATVYSYTTQWTGTGEFKFMSDISNWDSAYGAAATDGSVSGSLLGNNNGAQNIKTPAIGEYYTFTADLGTMTYNWTRLDSQTPAEYATIGIIGGFNNWGDDIDMTQVTPHNWHITYTFSADTEFKFRANDAWDYSWGGAVNIGEQSFGVSEMGGANMTVPAGTYDIYLNDITNEYVFVAK